MSKKIAIGASILSFAVGAALGHRLAVKRLEEYYNELADTEISEAKRHYQIMYKKDGFETPAEAVARLIPPEEVEATEALQSYQGIDIDPKKAKEDFKRLLFGDPKPEEEPKKATANASEWLNVFKQPPPTEEEINAFAARELSWEEEVETRTKETPYIISLDEFMANGWDDDQVSYVYFLGDKVLSNEQDKSIDNVGELVGADNLLRFGDQSGDEKIVYIRNELLALSMEVVRSEGTYLHEVLGLPDMPRDSDGSIKPPGVLGLPDGSIKSPGSQGD